MGDLPPANSKPIELGEKVINLVPGLQPADASIIASLALQAGYDDYSDPNGSRPFTYAMEAAFNRPEPWKRSAISRQKELENSRVPDDIKEHDLLKSIYAALASNIINRFSVHPQGELPTVSPLAKKILARDRKYNEYSTVSQNEPQTPIFRQRKMGRALTLLALAAAGKITGSEPPELPQGKLQEIENWRASKQRGL